MVGTEIINGRRWQYAWVPQLESGRTIHLADAHLTEYVPGRDDDRYNTLLKVFQSADNIVFAGDTLETELVDDKAAAILRIFRSRWGKLFDIANEKYVVWLNGNHDPEMPELPHPFWDVRTDIAKYRRYGKEITVMHGHQLHDASGHEAFVDSPIGRAVRKPYYRLQLFLNDSVIGSWFQRWYERFASPEHEELALRLDPRRELYVIAHRHKGHDRARDKGYIVLPRCGPRRLGWLVDDKGFRLKNEWTKTYRSVNPVTQRV